MKVMNLFSRLGTAIIAKMSIINGWLLVSSDTVRRKKGRGMKRLNRARRVGGGCLSILVWILLATTLNVKAQTINVDIQTASDPLYSGNSGVLSGSGTYWNNSASNSVNMQDESGSATTVDLILRQWLGSVTWSGGHALFGEGLSAGWSSAVIYDIVELDPYKSYDVALYFQSSRADVYMIDGTGTCHKLSTLGNSQTLPGTEGGEYLRFRALLPYEILAGQYGVKFYVYSQSSIIYEAIAGLQIKNTGTRANIPPHFPILSTPTNNATGVVLTPTLTASAFSDLDVGDTHANSQWQVDNNSDFSSPEWNSGDTYVASTSTTMSAGILVSGTYYWRVRYKDSAGNWSPYSSSFSFTLAAPEMDVRGNSISIADGDATPSLTDHTDFGPAMVTGGTVVRTFTITNSGTAALNLTGTPMVVVGGTQSNEFTMTAQPTTPVAAGGATTFQMTFDPAGAGLRSATLSIANDDSNENPYNFSIQGTGTVESLVISPSSTNVSSGAASGLSIGVTANVSWTAASNASWLAVTGGSSGSSNGTVTYGVAANVGTTARTGGVVVAGGGITRTCTVVQAGAAAAAAALGNLVWLDINGDGLQDGGEPGVSNVVVTLYDSQTNALGVTTTVMNGAYAFTNLMPGVYFVGFMPPLAYQITLRDQGGDDAVDSDADPATGTTIPTELVSGENDPTWDAGVYESASLGNFVWDDRNTDGIQDGDEIGISNVTVNLLTNGTVIATTTTDVSGAYAFTALPPWDYTVEVSVPAGWYVSPQDEGGDEVDSDIDTVTGQTTTITLVSGQNDPSWDGGLYRSASLSIAPPSQSVGAAAGTTTFSVTNTGGGAMAYTASELESWLSISSGGSGTNGGTITVSYDANIGTTARTGTVKVTASGSHGSPANVTVIQAGNAILSIAPLSREYSVSAASGQVIMVTGNVPWAATTSASWITITSGSFGAGNDTVTYSVDANGGAIRSGTITVSGGGISRTFTVNQWPVPATPGVSAEGDIDGDGTADISVFHPATGNWHISFNSGARWILPWGWSATLPVPADYNGDGMLDFAVYHPATGNWHIQESGAGQSRIVQFGWSATVPLSGDYDGDGKADLAVFHQAAGRWYFLCTTAGRYSVQWGWSTTIPVPADYDGDGATDIAVYHPASGLWQILKSSTGGAIQKQWGWSTAIPVPADYDGDGKADIAVFHRATGTWRISYSGGGSRTKVFGWSATIPVAADYDGDGAADLAVYHPATGNWHILKSTTGRTVVKNWGWSATKPTLLYPLIHSWFRLP